jgi:dienelactone hydrolase
MLAALVACTSPGTTLPFEPAGPEAAPDPAAPGPYPVGVRTAEVEDGAGGVLVVELWYPAVDRARGDPGHVYRIADLLTAEALEALPDLGDLAVELPTTAVRDAEPRSEPFPLVLFSHGASGMRMQSTYLTVHLASHGYVVAAPDHPGSTLSDTILAGELDEIGLFESLASRPGELAAVRDAVAAGDLGPEIVPDRLGVAGHSFGALTSVRWLLVGESADVVVAQALPPLEITALGQVVPLSEVEAKVQIHVGGIDETTPPADSDVYWADLPSPRGRLDLATAGHFTFSDMCLVDVDAIAAASVAGIGDAVGDGCAPDNVVPEVAHPVVRHFATAHLNTWLRDSPGSREWLSDGEAERLAPGEASFAE